MAIELLAPAGNVEIGKLAIRCGADAVYIGATEFSARQNAGNSVEGIGQLVAFGHRYMAKVYVALNTILKEREIVQAQQLLQALFNVGVDGVIVQDMGLLEAGIPPMPVIASTQTHNFDAAGVRFLEDIGVHRAILARELDPNKIAEIRHQTAKIELECFVHGALCVGYSGRCYLSHQKGGRSANKGNCAQPCRKMYSLVDENKTVVKTGHLLSVKDMCRLDVLDSLIDAGVTSFKIEGRLKNAAYVANTVSAYRQQLDTIFKKRGLPTSAHRYEHPITPDVNKTFHRGYVTHFATDNNKMANFKTPKMIGEFVGRTRKVQGNRIELDTPIELSAGDGLCFFKGKDLEGTRVQRVDGKGVLVLNAGAISKGTKIFRNKDHGFVAGLEAVKTERIVPLQMHLKIREGTLVLKVVDDTENQIEIRQQGALEPARNSSQMIETVKKQLKKTGGSQFLVASLTMDIKKDVETNMETVPFLKVSQLNELRRNAIGAIENARNAAMEKQRLSHAFKFTPAVYPKKVDRFHNVANPFAVQFYRRCGATEIEEGVESDPQSDETKAMTSRYCLRRELDVCLKTDSGSTLKGPLYLVDNDDATQPLQLKFNCAQCEMEVHR